MAEKHAEEAGQGTTSPLEQFLGGVEKLPALVVEGMIRQTENEDEQAVIKNLGVVLQNQLRELCAYLRERSRALTPQQQQEVTQVLRLSAAVSLATSGAALARNMSTVARLGLSQIVHEIKKVIYAIFDILGWHMPKWLHKIILLIDEILHDIFGVGDTHLATSLSRMEQDYLAELTQLAKLERESRARLQGDSEDDRDQ